MAILSGFFLVPSKAISTSALRHWGPLMMTTIMMTVTTRATKRTMMIKPLQMNSVISNISVFAGNQVPTVSLPFRFVLAVDNSSKFFFSRYLDRWNRIYSCRKFPVLEFLIRFLILRFLRLLKMFFSFRFSETTTLTA